MHHDDEDSNKDAYDREDDVENRYLDVNTFPTFIEDGACTDLRVSSADVTLCFVPVHE